MISSGGFLQRIALLFCTWTFSVWSIFLFYDNDGWRRRHLFNVNKSRLQRKRERANTHRQGKRNIEAQKWEIQQKKTKQMNLIEIHFQGFELYVCGVYLIQLLFGFLVDPMDYFDIVDTYRLNMRNNETDEKKICQTAIKFNCFAKKSIRLFMGEKQSGKCLQFFNCFNSIECLCFSLAILWLNLRNYFGTCHSFGPLHWKSVSGATKIRIKNSIFEWRKSIWKYYYEYIFREEKKSHVHLLIRYTTLMTGLME